MTPGLWGGVTALSWGTADFVARFSGRAVGHQSALFGMLLVGSAVLSLWVWLAEVPLHWAPAGLWLLGAAGMTTMLATLLLYQGLARGPLSVVSPIVGSYPALVVAFAVLAGARPDAVQWAAMAATLVGIIIVARSTGHFEEAGVASRGDLRKTVVIALGSAVAFAVAVSTAQLAVPIYGNLQTLWVTRVISLLSLLVLFLAQRAAPTVPLPWWPVLAAQGLLDAGGYLALYEGSYGEGAEIAAVTASTFGAVTAVLARLILREPIRAAQWIGIAVIFCGVAVLSI
ncbi:DMT family transporter [Rhodospirillaceae bacterium SYSU D60014]|uniref:DMT family transporter n=1 Tax=Virgifigura deserti TaxID=2268457 RepID=UPI000E66C802